METLTRLSSWKEKISQKISFLDNAYDCIIALASDGTVQSWNEGAQKIYGYSEQEIIGKNIRCLIPGENQAKFFRRIQKIQAGRPVFSHVSDRLTKDGQRLQTWFYMNTLVDQGGTSGAVFFAARDLSNRAVDQKPLRGIKPARLLVESKEEAVLVLDLKGRIVSWNEKAITITGYSNGEIAGKNHFALYPAESFDEISRKWEKSCASAISKWESWMARKDGSRFWAHITVTPLRDDSGNLTGYCEIVSDISEQKKSQEALRQQQNNLRILMENAVEITAILNGNSYITFISSSVRRFLNYEPSELIGVSIFDFIHPGDLFQALEGYAQILDGRKKSETMELRIRHKDGHWCVMEIKASNFLEDPGIRGMIVYARDLTEQKRLEDEILKVGEDEHRKIAEELHDGLTQELAGIEFIAKSLEQKIRQQFPQLLPEASRVASLMGQTVRSTRDLARGLYPMEMKASGFFNAVERFSQEMKHQFSAAIDLNYDRKIQICDERVATQSYYILREAVLNAVRHGQARRISIGVQQSEEKLVLTVRDNGNGMTQGTGQGIGLKIMNHRVRSLNGTLDILKNASGGTTFICSFPHRMTKGEKV